MKVTFLGTAAAEQYPGVWCSCDNCREARALGGRDIRRTSAAHFADQCLFDFPPEVFSQARDAGVDLLPTKLLLVTHSHEDHFYPQNLYWRYQDPSVKDMSAQEQINAPSARFGELPLLHVFGNVQVLEAMKLVWAGRELSDYQMDVTVMSAYGEYHAAGVDFIPLIANHPDRNGERGFIYLVHAQGRTLLYATDNGSFLPRTRDALRAHKLDAVIMEGTFGLADKGSGHMNLERVRAEVGFFEEANLWRGQPRVYLTHLSPHCTPTHDKLARLFEGTCVTPAYDGLSIEV